MQNVMIRIQEQFGFQELPHGLFHSFDHALRFELGGESLGMDRPILRFTQAHERAKAVSQTLFRNSSEVFVLLSSCGMEKPEKKRLKPLKLCGVKRSDISYLCSYPQQKDDNTAEFGSDLFRHWDVAQLKDRETVSEILWLGIASEMPIEPGFHGSLGAYLVDISEGLILHVYDDRGMDVIATKPAPLQELFKAYQAWLQQSDLPAMTAMFGGDSK